MTFREIRDKAKANGGILAPSEVMFLVNSLPSDMDQRKSYGARVIAEIAQKDLVSTEERGGDMYWLWHEDAEEKLTTLVNWFMIEDLSR